MCLDLILERLQSFLFLFFFSFLPEMTGHSLQQILPCMPPHHQTKNSLPWIRRCLLRGFWWTHRNIGVGHTQLWQQARQLRHLTVSTWGDLRCDIHAPCNVVLTDMSTYYFRNSVKCAQFEPRTAHIYTDLVSVRKNQRTIAWSLVDELVVAMWQNSSATKKRYFQNWGTNFFVSIESSSQPHWKSSSCSVHFNVPRVVFKITTIDRPWYPEEKRERKTVLVFGCLSAPPPRQVSVPFHRPLDFKSLN